MTYDRTKTEAAALGQISDEFVVALGPIEVPYLSFRKSELKRITESSNDSETMLQTIYDLANYRFRGTLPREDFDEFVSLEDAMGFVIANRSGQKKAVTRPAAKEPTSETTTPTSSTASQAF